jgi:hypothetical protein
LREELTLAQIDRHTSELEELDVGEDSRVRRTDTATRRRPVGAGCHHGMIVDTIVGGALEPPCANATPAAAHQVAKRRPAKRQER